MSTTADRVRELVEPLVEDLDVTVYDVEHTGGVLRILLQRDGGLDLSVLTTATRRISAELDAEDPLPSSYTLEVSSPGLERPLRTLEHFAGAVGEHVKIKTRPDAEGDRRVDGELLAAAGATVTIRTERGELSVALADVERAHTFVDWTPPPKPGAPGSGGSANKKKNTKKKQPTSGATDASGPSSPTGSPDPQSEATS